MQPNGRHEPLSLTCLNKKRFKSRRRRLPLVFRPAPLRAAAPELDYKVKLAPVVNNFVALSLCSRGPDLNVDASLVQPRLPSVYPPVNQQRPQHPHQEQQQQYQYLSSCRAGPGPGMEHLDEALQEREAIMASMANVSDLTKSECRINVLELFSDMEPAHLTLICEQGRWNAEDVVRQVVNDMEDGKPYPRIPRVNLKRKRDTEDDADNDDADADDAAAASPEKAAKKWDNMARRMQARDPKSSYIRMSHSILQQFFPQMYTDNLKSFMMLNGGILYPTYLLLSKAMAAGDEADPLFRKKKGRVPKGPPFLVGILDERIRDCRDQGEREALQELRAARVVEQFQAAEAAKTRRKEQQELENLEIARAEGTVADCGCCFVECAINRMVHCDGEELHFFCRDCARTMAETQIGMAKYNLDCMSTDGCTGCFARNQQEIFLDAKSRTALEQIEMDASIRASGIDNIETCPFCPFAAEYPDLEMDREFRCLHKDCGIVSCRACRKETHIPKTCAEAAIEQGHSARHGIEEAMSEALIRKCNKCVTPFIKEHGCNKMTCTKCGNIQCYVCSKSCDYSHFNDTRRGGKVGNCELFDKEGGVELRHREEVRAAEEEARKKVQEEHKDLDPQLLEFEDSEKLKWDAAPRKQEHGGRFPVNAGDFPHLHAGRRHDAVARGREFHPGARAGAHVVDPGRVEAAPPPPTIHPQAVKAGVAAVQHAPHRLPDPARVARQEPAMNPAYIWGHVAPARQAPAPVPAPALGIAPDPRPQFGFGFGQMMPFPPFENGILNQAMDQAFAQYGPTIRRSMPPRNYIFGQGPRVVANQEPHRAARVAPNIQPVKLVNDPFLLGPDFDPYEVPLPQTPERLPTTGPRQSERMQLATPTQLGAHNQSSLASARPEQPQGDHRDAPIVLSSPSRSGMVDLTREDRGVEAAHKLLDIEDGHFWPNLLDLDRHMAPDLEVFDPWQANL